MAQHTRAEDEALKRWVKGRKQIVEIGVAEGASALTLRQSMPADGVLTLIDPFHLSRFRPLNGTRRLARSAVGGCTNGRVAWIEEFSFQAVRNWTGEIDLLFIDGDHREESARQDWKDWHDFVAPGGLAVFHDARLFAKGWVTPQYGPLKVVDALFRTGTLSEWTIFEEEDSLVAVQRRM
jgi:predicted O-methyltransferase YrrM